MEEEGLILYPPLVSIVHDSMDYGLIITDSVPATYYFRFDGSFSHVAYPEVMEDLPEPNDDLPF